MNALTLAARYRNAKAERVRFHQMSPALQCMELIREYRELRQTARDLADDWGVSMAESSMEAVEREFAAARAELRASFTPARLERLADNPMQMEGV